MRIASLSWMRASSWDLCFPTRGSACKFVYKVTLYNFNIQLKIVQYGEFSFIITFATHYKKKKKIHFVQAFCKNVSLLFCQLTCYLIICMFWTKLLGSTVHITDIHCRVCGEARASRGPPLLIHSLIMSSTPSLYQHNISITFLWCGRQPLSIGFKQGQSIKGLVAPASQPSGVAYLFHSNL